MNILLISNSKKENDVAWFRQTLCTLLDKQIHVYHVTDYESAINQLDDKPVDVILINDTPPLQGLQLLEKLTNNAVSLPIILLARHVDPEQNRQALAAGAMDYLVNVHENPQLLAHAVRTASQWKDLQDELQRIRSDCSVAQKIAHLGIWEMDIATGEGHWSDEFYRICGLEPGSIAATLKHGMQLIHPDDREHVRAALKQVMDSNIDYDITHRIIRPDGEVRYVHAQAEIVKRGNPGTDKLVGMFIDNTLQYLLEKERKNLDMQMEQQVRERTHELEKAQASLEDEIKKRQQAQTLLLQENEFIAAVLDTVSALVVVLDEKGNIVGFNHEAEMLSGYSCMEAYGKSVWGLLFPDDEVQAARVAIEGLSNEQPSSVSQSHWLTRSGSRILIEWTNTILPDESGVATYIICSGIDITDRTFVQEADKRHMLDLFHLSRLSTMGEMATEIAHELNQPLAAIASYSDTCMRILASSDYEIDEVADTLAEIGMQAKRAGEIIRELRRFAHKQETHRSSIDMNQLIKEVTHLIEIETRYHHIALDMHLTEPLPLVMANKILIEQVILNLVRNAIEAMTSMDASKHNMRIMVSSAHNSMVKVSVSDTGTGIGPGTIGHIFEPFYTTKKDGTGMGLSICKSIINAHRGELWVTNNIDGGATFHFSLPIKDED